MPEQYPAWLSSTLASDAAEGRNVLPAWISCLKSDSTLIGPAFLVLASQDDNQAVVRAVAGSPTPGCILVVGGMSTSKTATIGGLMALEIQNAGISGLVTDGLVRDAREIRELGFPVWCRGTTPIASAKRSPGIIGETINIGGILIEQGDLIIADDDGVVVWPQKDINDLLKRAESKYDSDNVRLERLQNIARQRARQ
jgi:4-hydroxy-4-methyl-2-oxoglutarate aldolase